MSKKFKIHGITSAELEGMILHWERFAGCYFWSPPSSASRRRSEEHCNYRNIDFCVDGKPVNYLVSVSCSCKNYYCTRTLTIDGNAKARGLVWLKKWSTNGVFLPE